MTSPDLSHLSQLPYKQEVETVTSQIIGYPGTKGIGTCAREYFKSIPTLMKRVVGEDLLPGEVLYRTLKSSFVTAETFQKSLEAMATWREFDAGLAQSFLTQTIPAILSRTSLYRVETRPESLNFAWSRLSHQVGQKNVRVMSPLCPPYHYGTDRRGMLRHASGAIFPTIGERFSLATLALGSAFAPLVEQGTHVKVEFWTYSGETGNPRDLVDLGQDVIDHYNHHGNNELFQNLNRAFQELTVQASEQLGQWGIETETVSIEKALASKISGLSAEFTDTFPKLRSDNVKPYESEVESWLSEKIGMSSGWLLFFLQQEAAYREKQKSLLRKGNGESVVQAAMHEGLLYYFLIDYANRNDLVIFDLETTPKCMVGSLRHFPGPVLMGKPFDPKNVQNPLNVRQPFNMPTGI